MSALQTAHQESWGLGYADRFEFDFEAGLIQFVFEGDKIAIAPVTLIGTWSAKANEFLWGWDHPMCPPADNSAASAVKAYADIHDIDLLKTRSLLCESEDCWDLVAIACLIGDQQGVYRAPNGENFVFLGFGNITLKALT